MFLYVSLYKKILLSDFYLMPFKYSASNQSCMWKTDELFKIAVQMNMRYEGCFKSDPPLLYLFFKTMTDSKETYDPQ